VNSYGLLEISCCTPSLGLRSQSTLAISAFVRAFLKVEGKYVEIKCQLDATEVFIADLIACSTCFGHHYAHHQDLKSIIQWLLPVVFRAAATCKPET